ncbi:MAG TPA: hypothetical protein VNJ52_03220 [Patescibacteria group bacterium]|nr:hypothetical protein [Patescibacteria group bacterium]
MRRIQAITIVLTLLMAPLALLANGAAVTRFQKELSLIAQQDDCAHIALGICGCHPVPVSALNLISPLPDIVLPRPLPLPLLERRSPEFRAPDIVLPPGFSPVAFHPPRG